MIKINRKCITKCAVIIFLANLILLPISAKYKKSVATDGIAYADKFYFSSDYLNNSSPGMEGGAEYIIQGWDGVTPCDFTFQVRNYDNPMLYNNLNQDIKYCVESSSADERYIDYTVQKIEDGKVSDSLSGTLIGGSPQEDTYKVSINPKAGVEIKKDIRLAVHAKTLEPSPYDKTIATTIVLQKAQSSEFISDKAFIEPSKESVSLTYMIHTTSGVLDTGNSDITNASRKLHIVWDNSLVSIDRQNDLFIEAEHDSSRFYYSSDKKKGNLIIEVFPYSSVSISFYKKTLRESVWLDGDDYLWNTNSNRIVDVTEVK